MSITLEVYCYLLGRPTLVGKALSFTHELSFLCCLFYQFTALSSHVVDDHQMYSGSSVVGKALTINIAISSTPPLFYRRSKSAKSGVVFNITQIWFARVWKCSKISERWNKFLVYRHDRPMSSPSLVVKLGPRTPENHLSVVPHP